MTDLLDVTWTTVVGILEKLPVWPATVMVRVGKRDEVGQAQAVQIQLSKVANEAHARGYVLTTRQSQGGFHTVYEWCKAEAPLNTTALYNTATPLQRLQHAATYNDLQAVQVRTTDLQWLLDRWQQVCTATKDGDR